MSVLSLMLLHGSLAGLTFWKRINPSCQYLQQV